MTPKPPSNIAREQRDLWRLATGQGWRPPPTVADRTLQRWAAGQQWIPFAVLTSMTDYLLLAGRVVSPEYFAKPRLPAKEATDA